MNVGKWKQKRVLGVTSGLVRLLGGWLLLSLAACGAPVSEKAPGPVPSASKGVTSGAGVVVGSAQRSTESGNATGPSKQNDRNAVSSVQPTEAMDERNESPYPNLPAIVVKDLTSLDARDRYLALDYWATTREQVPLDAVFEALEDEDEGVRGKAEAIVEKRWAEEEKREKG